MSQAIVLGAQRKKRVKQALHALLDDFAKPRIASRYTPQALALLYGNLSHIENKNANRKKANEFFKKSLKLTSLNNNWGLHDSYAHTLWVGNILGHGQNLKANELVFAANALKAIPKLSKIDFIHGLAGLGQAALCTLQPPLQEKVLGAVVKRLQDLHETKSKHDWLNGERRKLSLGFSHGVPGVLATLSQAELAGFGGPALRRLINETGEFLLFYDRRNGGAPFPHYLRHHIDDPRNIRGAWCYGDPGVAWALALGGRAFKNKKWLKESYRIYSRFANKTSKELCVTDPYICHGTSGLTALSIRYLKIVDQPLVAASVVRFLDETLDLLETPPFRAPVVKTHRPSTLMDQYHSPLGSALVLISALADKPLRWDESFGLSVR